MEVEENAMKFVNLQNQCSVLMVFSYKYQKSEIH